MTFPGRPQDSSGCESEGVRKVRPDADRLINISDIRALFKLGRTAAYELTHRPEFPTPVQLSPRCLRWWASEVAAYAASLQFEGGRRAGRQMTARQASKPAEPSHRLVGTVRVARGRRQQE
jgi:predicted DNA-binding transcriptional regulator AlpA